MMSRAENVVQAVGPDRRLIKHQLQGLPCGRCYAVIEYDRGTVWSVVSELVNAHWKACPRNPHATSARMAYTPTSPSDTEIVLSPPITPSQRSSANLAVESVNLSNGTWISSAGPCDRKRRTREQRKLELEQDEYTRNITTKSVVCVGCQKEISLDKRSEYYPGLWLKHRSKCPSIEKLERAKTSSKVSVQLNNTQIPCDVVIPRPSGGIGCGDCVLEFGPSEGYRHFNTPATRQMVPYHDFDSSSSDEEEEDVDVNLPLPEPFPTLNSKFYLSQLNYDSDRSDASEWTYRYATKDEITANLFHGQNKPYVRLGSRPCVHLNPQTEEGHCENQIEQP